MKNIHIGGVYYGLHNIGDEAILLSILNSFNEYNLSVSTFGSSWIHEQFNNVEIRDIKVDYVRPKLGLYVDPKKKVISNIMKVKNEIKFYKTKDVYICGGATILSDCPWYSLRTVQIAAAAKIPTFLWGVRMADGCDIKTKTYIKNILNENYVKHIYTRDEYVKKRLIDIGVKKEKIDISYDAAITIMPSDNSLSKYLSEKQLSLYYKGEHNFVFSLSGEADIVEKTPIDIIASAIKNVQMKYNANIFLIPTGCGGHCKDIEFLKIIANKVNGENITVIENEFSPADLVLFLQKIDIIVSSRLHLNILGACAGTPSIGLVRNSKIIDFARLIGNPYLEFEDLTAQAIQEKIDDVINNKKMYTTQINMSVSKMRNVYEKSLSEIKNYINY